MFRFCFIICFGEFDCIVDATLIGQSDPADTVTATSAETPPDVANAVGSIITPRPGSAELDPADFAVVLLQALTSMAMRSKRRQADLMAALHGAGLPADPPRVRAALRLLHLQGAIEHLVPLSDGGLLLSVTHRATVSAAPAPDWLPLDALDSSAG
jgi:hypothetical protein